VIRSGLKAKLLIWTVACPDLTTALVGTARDADAECDIDMDAGIAGDAE
jgi:hypothetical protein